MATLEKTSSPISASVSATEEHSRLGIKDKPRLLATLIFPIGLTLWFCLDNTWPYWDGASHVLDSLKYRELFRHPHLLDSAWWHSLLTVNFCYPPQIHAVFGLLKTFLGKGLFVEQATAVLFSAVIAFSVFSIAYELFKSRLSAFLAVLILNSYPLVCRLSHMTYLDYTYLAFYSLAFHTIILFAKNPSWIGSLALGCAIGMAAASKQVAAFFLFFPCLFILCQLLYRREWRSTIQLIVAGSLAATFLLLWLVPNFETLQWFNARNTTHFEDSGLLANIIRNGSGYLAGLSSSMSPLLLGIFVLALPWAIYRRAKNLSLLFASNLGIGFLLILSSNLPEQRYIVPFFVLASIISGEFLAMIWQSKSWLARIPALLLVSLAGLSWLTFNFYPYPLNAGVLSLAANGLGIKSDSMYIEKPCEHPTPGGDIWGQEWIVETVDRISKPQPPGYLFVVPNDAHYNVHTLTLIGNIKNSLLVPTTSRIWTLDGDKVDYDPAKLDYYQWFLLSSRMPEVDFDDGKSTAVNTGESQELPSDSHSQGSLSKIESYVKEKCKLQAKRTVADGSEISLYRRISQ